MSLVLRLQQQLSKEFTKMIESDDTDMMIFIFGVLCGGIVASAILTIINLLMGL